MADPRLRRRAELVENVDWLATMGTPPSEWPGRFGSSAEALGRRLRRAGRADLGRPLQRMAKQQRTAAKRAARAES